MAKFTSLAVFTLLFELCEAVPSPTFMPSPFPTLRPTSSPSDAPSMVPSTSPSDSPSQIPSDEPSMLPSLTPSDSPSMVPSDVPSDSPSMIPSDEPSQVPSMVPSDQPSQVPSKEPSRSPSSIPSDQPSQVPSKEPSRSPSGNPTSSIKPSPTPSARPSGPTTSPTAGTKTPTSAPVATCDDTDGFLFDLVNVDQEQACEWLCKSNNLDNFTYRKTTYCDASTYPEIASNCCFSCAAGLGCDGNIAPTPTAPTPTAPTPTAPTPTAPTPTTTCVDDPNHTFTAPWNADQTQDCEYIAKKICARGPKFCETDPNSEKFISNERSECCATCAKYDSECDVNIAPTPTAPTPTAPTPTAPAPTTTCADDSSHTFDAPFNILQPTQDCAYIAKKICPRGAKYCDPNSEKFISNQRSECCATCAKYDSECDGNQNCSDDAGTPITLKWDNTKKHECSWLTLNNKEKRQGNYCLGDGSKYDVAVSCCASCKA